MFTTITHLVVFAVLDSLPDVQSHTLVHKLLHTSYDENNFVHHVSQANTEHDLQTHDTWHELYLEEEPTFMGINYSLRLIVVTTVNMCVNESY